MLLQEYAYAYVQKLHSDMEYIHEVSWMILRELKYCLNCKEVYSKELSDLNVLTEAEYCVQISFIKDRNLENTSFLPFIKYSHAIQLQSSTNKT